MVIVAVLKSYLIIPTPESSWGTQGVIDYLFLWQLVRFFFLSFYHVEQFGFVAWIFWILYCTILSPVEILWRMLIIFIFLACSQLHWVWSGQSGPHSVGCESNVSSVFSTFAMLFGSSLHMCHLGIHLELGQASKPLIRFGSVPHTCMSGLYWFRHRIRESISSTLCSLGSLPLRWSYDLSFILLM